MKHITFTDKSVLVGDTVADLLIQYAALLVQHDTADAVDVHVFSSDGDEVQATFLLSAGAPLMAETAHTSMDEPDNTAAIEYMRAKMDALRAHPAGLPLEENGEDALRDLEF